MTRAPAKAPYVPWPPVKGDTTIAGDKATGKIGKCKNCRKDILEVEIWHFGFNTTGTYSWEPTGRFMWIHYEPNMMCVPGAEK